MALRAASMLARRAAAVSASTRACGVRSIVTSGRAFMSTSSEIFSAPAFPVKSASGFEGTDPAVWLEQYAKADPSDMWLVGSFPRKEFGSSAENQSGTAASSSVLADDELWDTAGMLSALSDDVPVRDGTSRGVDEILREIDAAVDGYFADSVLKKRRKKMNKHKHRKRKKALRMRTKKN
jgi:hypothetical protein